jgi:hypothetical protein
MLSMTVCSDMIVPIEGRRMKAEGRMNSPPFYSAFILLTSAFKQNRHPAHATGHLSR